MIKLFGYTVDQWARVCATFPDMPADTLHDFLMLKRAWVLRWQHNPEVKPVIVNIKPKLDYDKAVRIFELRQDLSREQWI